jgi:excisionase family DNA binding protein
MQRKPRPHGKFLSIRDAEAEYGLPYHTIYRWVERGQLARLDADVVGKAILIKRADLDAFLASNMTAVRS